jgi:hypothetical protein
MSSNPIENELNQRIGEVLVPRGYRFTMLDKHTEGFVRAGDGIRHSIIIPMWDHAPAFEFSLTTCIRVEAVEAISNLFSGVCPEYHSSSDTCVINLPALVPHLDRLTVYDAATIRQAVDQLAPHITDRILPFLDSHRDVRSLDRLMNQGIPPEQVWGMEGWGSWLLWYAMSAIILARLAQNPDFDELVDRYRHETRDFDDDDKERYEKLVEHLRSLT